MNYLTDQGGGPAGGWGGAAAAGRGIAPALRAVPGGASTAGGAHGQRWGPWWWTLNPGAVDQRPGTGRAVQHMDATDTASLRLNICHHEGLEGGDIREALVLVASKGGLQGRGDSGFVCCRTIPSK